MSQLMSLTMSTFECTHRFRLNEKLNPGIFIKCNEIWKSDSSGIRTLNLSQNSDRRQNFSDSSEVLTNLAKLSLHD